ncbi:unnamed protein product, partial [Mesorhabditis belari]|uniref:Uncharacterized protein n=1 Tax=Mesorhabditis belari TaxID=2138241 RepID=A0AAF3FFL2_9BILA
MSKRQNSSSNVTTKIKSRNQRTTKKATPSSVSEHDQLVTKADGNFNVFAGADAAQYMEECIRQKKFAFFQSDNGRPAELYRTDLIHRCLRGEGEFKFIDTPDDRSGTVKKLRIVDRWREQWSTCIQVLVDPENLQEYPVKPREVVIERKLWKQPKKLIGYRSEKKTKRYVDDASHEIIDKKGLQVYQGDLLDQLWVDKYNETHPNENLCINKLIDVLNYLEIECHQNLHLALIELLNDQVSQNSVDEDAACDICRTKECEQDDEMIFCDGCNMCVHLSCYGLQDVPADDWLCSTCELCLGRQPPCVLCPVIGGAMKRTDIGTWAHIVCALFHPECRFGDPTLREPVCKINDILSERWGMKCSICDTRQGACIQCSVKTCTTAFHVACCQRSGCEFRIEQEPLEDSVKFITLCQKHSHQEALANDQMAGEISRIEGKTKPIDISKNTKSHEMALLEKHFFDYATFEKLARSFGDGIGYLKDLYDYWVIKRISLAGSSLIRSPDENESSTVEGAANLPSFGSGLSRWAYGTGRIFKELDMFRNCCFMQVKREKTKAMLAQVESQIISEVLEVLGARYSPTHRILSSRTSQQLKMHMQKLIGSEDQTAPNSPCKKLNDLISEQVKSRNKLCRKRSSNEERASSGDSSKEQIEYHMHVKRKNLANEKEVYDVEIKKRHSQGIDSVATPKRLRERNHHLKN